jgi:small subunit ribosomal protein S1
MKLEVRVLEVDPIHRRIVLAVTDIPADQPPRPETPSKVIPMDSEVDIGYPPIDPGEGSAEPR